MIMPASNQYRGRPRKRTLSGNLSAHDAPGVIIASINREEGDTGVHTHTRMLRGGLQAAGVNCKAIGPFSGSSKWLPIFAVRPLVLKRVNKTWSTLWHRYWHAAALRENLLSALADGRNDAVLAQCPVSAHVALDVRTQLRGDFPVAMVCHFNGSEAQEYRDKGELRSESRFRAMLDFENQVLRDVDQVIYVSNWARESVEGSRGVTPRSATVIWNGLADVSPGLLVSRKQLGLSDDDLVLINVGSLEQRKNQLGLIDLFEEISAEHPKARLVLVGDGPQRPQIEAKIAAKGLIDRVKLLGMRRDVPALLGAADIYVHYATLENCPIVLLEAARTGLPCAAIPTGGVPELLEQLQSGVALDPLDAMRSLNALDPLLTNPSVRSELGQRARENFVRRFTAEAMTQQYMDALGVTVTQTA